MAVKLDPKSLVTMAFVADLVRSLAFYRALGFEARNTFTPDDASEPTWTFLASGAAQLMLTKASEPVVPEQQAVLFYLYFDDIAAVHAQLTGAGLQPEAMTYPFFCPKGEFRLRDPDGYCLMLTHT